MAMKTTKGGAQDRPAVNGKADLMALTSEYIALERQLIGKIERLAESVHDKNQRAALLDMAAFAKALREKEGFHESMLQRLGVSILADAYSDYRKKYGEIDFDNIDKGTLESLMPLEEIAQELEFGTAASFKDQILNSPGNTDNRVMDKLATKWQNGEDILLDLNSPGHIGDEGQRLPQMFNDLRNDFPDTSSPSIKAFQNADGDLMKFIHVQVDRGFTFFAGFCYSLYRDKLLTDDRQSIIEKRNTEKAAHDAEKQKHDKDKADWDAVIKALEVKADGIQKGYTDKFGAFHNGIAQLEGDLETLQSDIKKSIKERDELKKEIEGLKEKRDSMS